MKARSIARDELAAGERFPPSNSTLLAGTVPVTLTVPALIRNRLVVGDFEGYLHALSADDGSLVGRLQVDDTPVRAAPVVDSETLFVYTAGGVLAAIGID